VKIPLLTKKPEAPSGPQVRRSKSAVPEGAPAPQPERHEPRIEDPGLTELSKRDYKAILIRAAKEAMDDQITDLAAALAYYAFLAIPAVLLVSIGLFGLFADPQTVNSLMDELRGVVPADAINLVDDSLTRITQNKNGGLIMALLGLLLALWTVTGAMNALMRGLNISYDRKETRGFVVQRLTALGMLACLLVAVGLSFGLLVLGPYVTDWIGSAVGIERVIGWIWWTLQWPILIGGLLLAFGGLLYLGPNVDHPKFRFITPGSAFAVVVWIVASGLFAVYVSMFGSYNKAWGSLAAVIVMLTWLWLSALALLFGAEINAEAERSRELREGRPAERELQAPTKS
jgi:membrane protein